MLVDGFEAVRRSRIDDSAPWSAGEPTYHFGIADHMNNSGPLQVYVDEMSAGTASFQDCFGWNAAVCPFGSGTADTTAPAAPRRLALR